MLRNTNSLAGGRTGSFAAAAETFLDHLRLAGRSPATVLAHGNALRQLGRLLGERDLREIAPADLEAYAAEVRTRLRPESVYVYLYSVRRLFAFLVERGALLADPAAGLILPGKAAKLPAKALSKGEMAKLLSFPDTATPAGLRDRALLEVLYSTGLRVSEGRKVRVDDLGDDFVLVRAGKGGKDRKVPLGAAARQWLDRYLAVRKPVGDTPELWLTDRGRSFGAALFPRHVRLLGRAAGLTGVTCHAIRRSMASHLLAAGASPSAVASILGHEDLRSLSRYAAVAAIEVKKSHEMTHPREIGS